MVKAQSNMAKFVDTAPLDIPTKFLELTSSNIRKSNRENLAGATVNEYDDTNTTIIAWFNGHPYHTQPLALNLVHNAIVKALVGTDHSIKLYNHPMAIATNINSEDEAKARGLRYGGDISLSLGLLLTFASANYIMSYVKVNLHCRMSKKYFHSLLILSFRQERTCKSKLLQLLSGVNVITFWTTSFLWDLLTFVITILLIILTLAPFQIDYWSSPEELGPMFVALFAFSFAMLPMNYVFSLFFKSPTGAMQLMVFINVITGN